MKKNVLLFSISILLLLACRDRKGSSNPVRTLNEGYSRTASHVLVREVRIPTRANLDHAAYGGNVMLWDPVGDTMRLPHVPNAEDLKFGGLLSSFHKTPEELPLSAAERNAPLYWKPALDFLLEQNFDLTRALAEAYGKVSSERWGFTGDTPPLMEFTDLYLSTKDSTAWVKVELKPWVQPVSEAFTGIAGRFPFFYARVNAAQFTPRLFALLRGDYSAHVLTEPELIDYGHQLAAYWYPSRNTDFQDLRGRGPWPGDNVEADVRAELKGLTVAQPLFALRGKPHGRPVYFALTVPGVGAERSVDSSASASNAAPTRAVADNLGEYLSSIRDRENSLLDAHGKGSWEKWKAKLAPFQRDVSALLQSQPASVMALKGKKDFLIFRRELEYLQAGDLQKLSEGKNPVEAIAALRDSLASLGIDFLFIPIPTKQDIYPDLVSKAGSRLPGGTAQPYFRKLLLDLSDRQVETLDLLTPFQEAAASEGLLYQRQDTHWTSQGLELAAKTVAERVMSYVWFGEAYAKEIPYMARDTVFPQLGDLYDRLPADAKTGRGPEKLNAHPVMLNGKPYEDDPNAPVLVLGDSYTGVYELTGCRHAGVTAQLAKDISGPVDLIMGWGGGPEARNKLRRAGPEALKGKRLVIWMMSVRDLFVYPGGWSL